MHSQSQDQNSWPAVFPGFDHIPRIWDATQKRCAAKVLPGEYYVTSNDEIITTVLGSCVSACVRDPVSGIGGMNHFMLPGETTKRTDKWGGKNGMATRYGIAAMETLINEILKRGSRRDRLELKMFGGGRVLAMTVNNVGDRNIDFAKRFAKQEGLYVAAEDLGGEYPRKINYFPKTGRVMVRRLRALQNKVIVDQERCYQDTLANRKITSDIELFD